MNTTSALLAHIDIPPRLLASLIVLGIVLVIWFFKAVLSSGTTVSRAGAPTCTTCGQQAHWLTPQNFWNCMRCNKPVQPGMPGQPPGQQPMPGQPSNNPYTGQPIQPQMQPPPGPTCATCGGPGRWLAEANAWGCDRCRQLIQPR